MSDFGALSLLPPLIAIILAIWTKRVILALLSGVWIGGVIVPGWDPATGTVQTIQWILFSVTSAWKENGVAYHFLAEKGKEAEIAERVREFPPGYIFLLKASPFRAGRRSAPATPLL